MGNSTIHSDYISEDQTHNIPDTNQTANIRLSGQYDVEEAQSDKYRFTLAVNLDGTAISAAESEMEDNSNQNQGYFVEKIDVCINAKDQDGNSLELFKDMPETTPLNESVTTGITYGVHGDLSGNVGAMGDIPTGGITAGVGGSISISQSNTKQIQNFRIENKSDQNTAFHSYCLAADDGGEYTDWESLEHNDLTTWNWFKSLNLVYAVPKSAYLNIPIVSQALFLADFSVRKITLIITISVTLRRVWADTEYLDTGVEYQTEPDSFELTKTYELI